jgi:hypothetical protein
MFAFTVIVAAVTEAGVGVISDTATSIWINPVSVKSVSVKLIMESLSPAVDVRVASLMAAPVVSSWAATDRVKVTPSGIPVNVRIT